MLTVIASESYESFAKQLQSEIAETLSDRPQKANAEFFQNNIIKNESGEELFIDRDLANILHRYFIRYEYVDNEDNLTETYYRHLEEDKIELPEEFRDFKAGVLQLVGKIFTGDTTSLVEDGRAENIKKLELNENFKKKEFQELWDKLTYYVDFDTDELIKNCITALDRDLNYLI